MKPATKRADVLERERRQRSANDGRPRVRLRPAPVDDPGAVDALLDILARLLDAPEPR